MDNEPPIRNLIIVAAVLVSVIIIGLGVVVATRPEPVAIVVNPPLPTATPAPTGTPAPIFVYMTGAVNNPQVTLSLPVGARVQDAIDAAGGLTANADMDRVNLAGLVRDGDQVHVFAIGETVNTDATIGDAPLATPSGGEMVFINRATLEELDALPGIGPAIAQRIIDYREANGPFPDLQSLMNVSGIGESTIANIEGLVSFE